MSKSITYVDPMLNTPQCSHGVLLTFPCPLCQSSQVPECNHLECRNTCQFRDAANTGAVHHPRHYNMGSIEVIDAIDAWGLGFDDGNAVKYIARARHKGKEVEDLEKALWYLQHRLDQIKGKIQPVKETEQ